MGKVTFRVYVLTRFAPTFGGMIDEFFSLAPAKTEEPWIVVEREGAGPWTVVDDNLTVKSGDSTGDATDLGFSAWDDEVEDLDAGNSDESSCFGMSNRLRWNDVHLKPYEFRAPSIERLLEALAHVAFCAWCPGDI